MQLLGFILLLDVSEFKFEGAKELWKVFRSLLRQGDGHFLSTAACLLLAILTGRSDLCISGLFGAGKTRAAAALIGGLGMDSNLNILVRTKGNAAAQTFADHFLSLAAKRFRGRFHQDSPSFVVSLVRWGGCVLGCQEGLSWATKRFCGRFFQGSTKVSFRLRKFRDLSGFLGQIPFDSERLCRGSAHHFFACVFQFLQLFFASF